MNATATCHAENLFSLEVTDGSGSFADIVPLSHKLVPQAIATARGPEKSAINPTESAPLIVWN